MSAKAKKNKNIFAAYFKPFGIRQVCDLLMLAGAIVIFVGLFTLDMVTVAGMGIYVLACLLAIYRAARVMLGENVNKRSPEYKNAFINVIIMSVILLIAVFGIIFILVF